MNTPKLPPLPPQSSKVFRTAIGSVEVLAYSAEDMQAYAIAAIEAQGMPMVADFNQLQAMQAEWHAVSHDNSITSEAKFQRVYKAAMRASAPPAPQTHETNQERVAEGFVKRACPYCESIWYGQKDYLPYPQTSAAQQEPTYTAADVTAAHTEGYKLGMLQAGVVQQSKRPPSNYEFDEIG